MPPRTLDPQGFMSATDPRTFPTNDIRRLEASSGNPNAIIGGTQQQSGDIGQSVLDLLKQYQKFGRQTEVAGQEQQISRISQTQPNLIGASPTLQSSVRNASVQAIEPTIGGARDLIAESKALMQEYQQTEEKNMTRAQGLIQSAMETGSAGLEELLKVNPDIFKKAGYDTKSFEAVLKGLKRKEALNAPKAPSRQTQVIEMDGKKILIDSNTGETIKEFGAGSSGTTPLKLEARNIAEDLLNKTKSGQGGFALGKTSIFGTLPGTKSRDFVKNLDQVKSLLSLDNIKYLKGQGQVSDAERDLLQKASTQLGRDQSEEAFRQTLENIVQALGGDVGGMNNLTNGNTFAAPSGKSYTLPY